MPERSADDLRRELQRAGFANTAIDAVWPRWWSDEASDSEAASAELRYTLARRLGLSPSSLFDEEPRFVWHDEAKFKNLGTTSEAEQAVLASFGVAVGRSVTSELEQGSSIVGRTAEELREAILASSSYVGLTDLLSLCWAIQLPVVALAVFPLGQKRMHAMTVTSSDKFAILIGRESRYAARTAYMIAHEIGHIALGHLTGSTALLEIEDPLLVADPDAEEVAADRFALTLLTGSPQPEVATSEPDFTASQLAQAVSQVGPSRSIDPGVLALCAGHATGRWEQAIGALKVLQNGGADINAYLNSVAAEQLAWDDLPHSRQEYLERVLGLERAA